MIERRVGSRLPDFSQVRIDLALRRGKSLSRWPAVVDPDGLRRTAALFERENGISQVPSSVAIEPAQVGTLPAEWVTPRDVRERAPIVLYFHGGGFVKGSPRSYRPLSWRLAQGTERRILALEYRKEPDHPFPAWVDDGAMAFRWLLDRGHAPASIALAGDSAGGNIALAVTHRLRREGAPVPGALVLYSPWADLACEGASYRRNSFREAMVRAESTRSCGAYLTRGIDPRNPEASPVHADFTGFPPMLVFAGSREIFLDDARQVARRAAAAGVRTELHVFRHMPHAFPILAGLLPRARTAFTTTRRFLEELPRS
jgi:acetyl esterase/lipase